MLSMPEAVHEPFTVALVVNPTAKRGRGATTGRRVEAALHSRGIGTEFIAGVSPSHTLELAREAASRVAGFVIVGGDGLVSLMLQAAEVRALPFAVFPAGSGNDFALAFGFRARPDHFVSDLFSSRHSPKRIDAATAHLSGAAEPVWFAASLGLGLIARVNRRANSYRLPLGPLGYQIALLRELLSGRDFEFTVQRDDNTAEARRALLVSVMNLQTQGGGIRLAPNASFDDGELDLVEVAPASRRRLFSVLPLLATAKHERLPEVSIRRIREAQIAGPDMLSFADGDALGEASMRVRIEPGALTVWVPTPR